MSKYKFKDWVRTETHKVDVTEAMRRRRAKEIAEILSDNTVWKTHGRPISMQVLTEQLQLRIKDLSQTPGLHKNLRADFGLLADDMQKRGLPQFVHSPHPGEESR